MTPAFFRRWLKREREEVLSRQAQRLQATGTTGREFASSSMRESHIKELVSFVNGIDRDYEAVRAGITIPGAKDQ